MNSIALFVSFFLVAIATASPIPASTAITHFALLTGDQEGTPTGSSANGIAVLNYNSVTGMLSYQVIHNVVSPTASHIHGPAFAGNDGGVIVTISADGSSPITGTTAWTVSQAQLLNSGQLYINVHSNAFSGGEIRGQILVQGGSVVSLTGGYVVPPVTTAAVGHAFLQYNAGTHSVSWNLTHSVVNATQIHFHGPANNTASAGVETVIAANGLASVSPVVGSATSLASTIEAHFTSGLEYINVHSQVDQGGEIRGQVFFPNVQWAVVLDGTQDSVTTNNIGAAVISMSSDKTMLNVAVISTIPSVTACHIHGPGAPGVIAGPLVTLTATTSSWNYYIPITSTVSDALAAGTAYVNVHTAANPNGEIRGQIAALGTPAVPATGTTGIVGTTANGVSTTRVTSTTTSPSGNGSQVIASIALIIASIFVLIA